MRDEVVLRVVQRLEEGHTLDVIPMKVRREDPGGKVTPVGGLDQVLSQGTKAGPAIENVAVLSETHFHAGGVASITHLVHVRGRSRPADAPKLDSHRLLSECG
jgi:hypothetical protein